MPVVQKLATEYTCDGCGSITYAVTGVTPPGYSGSSVTMTNQYGTISETPDWWAHTKRCIPGAIRTVLKKAQVVYVAVMDPAK